MTRPPRPQTLYEASAAYTAAVYRLGAEIARIVRLHDLAHLWEAESRVADDRRRRWRRHVMGPHYDGR